MAPKFDLDALIASPLEVRMNGEAYIIQPLGLREFLALEPLREQYLKAIQESFEKDSKKNNEKVALAAKALIRGYAPSIENGVLDALTPRQLMALMNRLQRYQGASEDEGEEEAPGKVQGGTGGQ